MSEMKMSVQEVGKSSVVGQLWNKVPGKERVYVKEYRRGGVHSELVYGVNERAWIQVNGYPCRAVKNAAVDVVSEILGREIEGI